MRELPRRGTALPVLTLTLLIATSCGGVELATDTFCQIAEPIYDSVRDTEETRRQIDREWAKAVSAGCGWPDFKPSE